MRPNFNEATDSDGVEMTGNKLSRKRDQYGPMVMATIGLLIAVAAAWATQDSNAKHPQTSTPAAYAAGVR